MIISKLVVFIDAILTIIDAILETMQVIVLLLQKKILTWAVNKLDKTNITYDE